MRTFIWYPTQKKYSTERKKIVERYDLNKHDIISALNNLCLMAWNKI